VTIECEAPRETNWSGEPRFSSPWSSQERTTRTETASRPNSVAADLLSSLCPLPRFTAQSRLSNKSAAQQLDTSLGAQPSELTKDDVDGDKATPSAEDGDDDDGPVMPKAIPWPAPPTPRPGAYRRMNIGLIKRGIARTPSRTVI